MQASDRNPGILIAWFVFGWTAVVGVQWLRRSTDHAEPLTTFYGFAPNLIAAYVAPLLVIVVAQRYRRGRFGDFRWFARCVATAALIIAAWECAQAGPGSLVFDPNDLLATAAGAGACLASWPLLRRWMPRS